jgi:hypothetical protein
MITHYSSIIKHKQNLYMIQNAADTPLSEMIIVLLNDILTEKQTDMIYYYNNSAICELKYSNISYHLYITINNDKVTSDFVTGPFRQDISAKVYNLSEYSKKGFIKFIRNTFLIFDN